MADPKDPDEILAYNRRAWDREVAKGNRWTVPVNAEAVAQARAGVLSLVLTPQKPVPAHWLGEVAGAEILGLASGGGQQMPLLAAAGAKVSVIDNAPGQLARDAEVAAREGLEIHTVLGDMGDLSAFESDRFDLIFHPCANIFRPSVRPVWREAHRVLKPGGRLLSGFCNPVVLLLDPEAARRGEAVLRFTMPYSDLDLSEAERQRWFPDEPLCFAHSLEDQLGGQTAAGFALIDLYEDYGDGSVSIDRHLPAYMATLAVKRG